MKAMQTGMQFFKADDDNDDGSVIDESNDAIMRESDKIAQVRSAME